MKGKREAEKETAPILGYASQSCALTSFLMPTKQETIEACGICCTMLVATKDVKE